MSHAPRVQGALAASTAALCMLGIAASALASGDATGDPLPGQGRCAGTAVEQGAVERGARFTAGPRPPTAAREAGIRGTSLACAASRAAGLRLVQSEAGPAQAPADEDGEEGESRQGPGEGAGEEAGEEPGDAAEGEPATADERAFEGTARPASPDLTLSEERALISRGWE